MTDDLRKKIDAADESLFRQFRTRLDLVDEIARYKRSHGLPAEDAARERAMLDKKADKPWEQALLLSLLDISKRYQRSQFNIYLTGMPYAGKSTMLRALTALSEREACDTDEIIVSEMHMTIPQIFERKGESAFRDAESEVLRECAEKGSMIVSTGGGIVTRKENIALMKNSGIIVLCDRPLEDLCASFESDTDASRPLIKSRDDLELLYFERFRAYRENADMIIRADKAGAAEAILDFARDRGLTV